MEPRVSHTNHAHSRVLRRCELCQDLVNFPTFLALAVLAMIVPETDMAFAKLGAAIFVVSRAIFHVVYMMGIPVLRSVIWTAGWIGQIMMAVALV